MADELVLPQSESLSIEVLGLLQSLIASMDEVKSEIQDLNKEIKSIHRRIDAVIFDGFIDGNLIDHRVSHEHRGFLRRIFG